MEFILQMLAQLLPNPEEDKVNKDELEKLVAENEAVVTELEESQEMINPFSVLEFH